MSIPKSNTMPISLYREYTGCYLPHCRCSANVLADSLKISPLYKQQDSERWNAAVFYYQEMMNNREQCCTSPPNSPAEYGSFGKPSISGTSSGSISPRRETCINDSRLGSGSLCWKTSTNHDGTVIVPGTVVFGISMFLYSARQNRRKREKCF